MGLTAGVLAPNFPIVSIRFGFECTASRAFASEQPAIAQSSPVVPHSDSSMTEPPVQLDPLNSPYPVPWSWVQAMLAESATLGSPALRYYRSPALLSPDGTYAAYSRIQIQIQPNFTQSRVGSVLFLENLHTGDLQTITAVSPFADNPFLADSEPEQAGTIAILIPVAWSETGDRILAREFESLFGTDLASDYAVVWERESNQTYTIAPTHVDYTNAVLLGWSQTDPTQVLFRAGQMGQEEWDLWAVNVDGLTIAANDGDQPLVYGQVVTNVWAGPQAYRR